MEFIQIALDGPSGAGKSTVAKSVAKRLGFTYVDTGALYRTIGLFVFRANIDPENAQAVCAVLPQVQVDLSYDENGEQQVYLNGECVSTAIRENIVSHYASCVSKIPQVRAFLLDTQRSLSRRYNIIMDGRDIGTVIFPQAKVKIFLFASAKERARRRVAELKARGQDVSFSQILAEMEERDARDATRAVAPCVPAADAVMLDSSALNFEQTVDAVLSIIREKSEGSI